ncbi:MAG: Vms1/Ankzf1 family peptidyl-tRNA hydrolase [Methanosarcinaceae archaeon]|nr:Vms1/Ankzf1 family peptidyl-tRNA hydrolase [Methanosarcinaceae archaeon]MDD4749518.1 Vms1/Ankzf1 family peptidyl-tRNA hydrolase [Methanosarcinaceae archaeon]
MLILLLHAGESFVGFAPDLLAFESEELIRSSVKEKHTKGGFSQRRFERLREEDIAHHLEKVLKVVNKILEEKLEIDCVILGGDTQLIKEIEKRLPFELEILEKSMDLKLERLCGKEVLSTVLSCRRYLL